MSRLISKLRSLLGHLFRTAEQGQNLTEYGLILALITFGATAAMKTVGSDVSMIYSAVSKTIGAAIS